MNKQAVVASAVMEYPVFELCRNDHLSLSGSCCVVDLSACQGHTLTIRRPAHRAWRNPHLLRSFQAPSRDNHRKASYPRTQQRDQGPG